jgi:hypothetical protein
MPAKQGRTPSHHNRLAMTLIPGPALLATDSDGHMWYVPLPRTRTISTPTRTRAGRG